MDVLSEAIVKLPPPDAGTHSHSLGAGACHPPRDQRRINVQYRRADATANATATYVRILLPGVPSGGGYIVSLVNTSNPAQQFARSEEFKIEDGAGEFSTSVRMTLAGVHFTVQGCRGRGRVCPICKGC
jgi:hypothetical protein